MDSNLDLLSKTDEAIAAIESGEATREQVIAALAFMDRLSAVRTNLKTRIDGACLQWVKQNGEFDDGVKKYYVGKDKTVKVRNLRNCVQSVLTHLGGDIDSFILCLSTGAFKPATTIKALEAAGVSKDEVGELFETTVSEDLKFKAVDKRFLGEA